MTIDQMHISGMSTPQIAKQLNIKTHQVVYYLKKTGIQLRSNKENYKVHCDHNYFSKIDNEAKAYFLGLLTADGQVQKN